MKLFAEIKNQTHKIKIERKAEKIFAEIDEKYYELEASEPEPNVFLLKYNNQIYQAYVAPNNLVSLGKHQFEITLTDPKRLRGSSVTSEQNDGASEIKTAMPGKVVRVLVDQGSEIKQGESVIVVEAMKMQNEMKSPKDGVIKEIRFHEGSTVNAGDILVVIE